MNLATLILLAIKAAVFLTVFSIGLHASMQDATYLLKRPAQLLRALVAMNVVMPVCAIILILTFNPQPAIKIALLALSLSPVPPIFPKKAAQTGGGASYILGLLIAAGLFAVILVPLTLELVQRIFAVPLQMSTMAIAQLVIMTIVAPLAAGMALRSLAPALVERIANPIALVATVLLFASALPILITAWPAITSLIGDGTVVAFVLFTIVGLAAGHLLGGPAPEDRPVLAFAATARHPGIAVAIASANFSEHKLTLAAVLLYVLVSTITTIPYLKWRKRVEKGPPPVDDHARIVDAKNLHASG